jgi:hypothetical protein
VSETFGDIDVGERSAPAPADLDGDGDLDLLIGSEAGTVFAYRNDGAAPDPGFVPDEAAGFATAWRSSAPAAADLDGDGATDVIVGTESGGLGYFGGVYLTATEPAGALPGAPSLGPAYPNPFSDATSIPFTLHQPAHVRLVVYDALGREAAVLIDAHLPAGAQQATFDARRLPGGLYLYTLTAGAAVNSGTLLLVR